MKVAFIVLSILSAMMTWWWVSQPRGNQRAARRPAFIHRLAQSLVAGVAVYFSLMAIAMIWLLVTT